MGASITKKVWILSSNRWNSAITEYAINAAQALKRHAGCDVLFSPLKNSAAHVRALGLGINCEEFLSFGVLQILRFRAIEQMFAPDLILLMGGPETFLSSWGMDRRVPTWRLFADASKQIEKLGSIAKRWSYRNLSGFLTPSQALVGPVAKVTNKKALALMLGCDDQKFYFRDAQRTSGRPELLIFGRLDPVKGHARAMEIFACLLEGWREEETRPLLHIAGLEANITVTDLKKLAHRCGINHERDLRFSAMRIADVPALLASAAIGLVPSLGSELICRVTQEFLLCGTPVLVSTAGSLAETLFKDAGTCFEIEGDRRSIAAVWKAWLLRSREEGWQQKKLRAEEAARRFGLRRMATDLQNLI